MTVAAIHPRFARMLSRQFLPSLCDVEEKTVVSDGFGQDVETWSTVQTMRRIPCATAPLSAIERQAAGYTVTDQVWHALLTESYPEITTRHRVLIDDVDYDIDAVEAEPHGSLTRLTVRKIGV